MIHLITPHSMERTGIPLRINSMSLDLKERESTASLTLDDREGISNKQITGMWFYDDEDPGAGMVWRARSLSESLHTKTPVIQLEHIISTLKDTIIFDEVTPATITGDKNAKTVSAKAAINYILNRQETKDWKLYSFDPSYEEISQGYSFEGDTLYDALVTVCSTLEGCWWQYDTNHYPFRLYILNHTTMPWADTMLRAGRNMRTISVTTDKSGMYTRFWPVGKDDLHLTSSPNYKNDYILSSKASTYGVIDHTETDSTLETVSDLAAFARARLRKHSAPVVKIEVEGLELQKATMTPEDKIVLGGLCEIVIGETGTKYEEKIIGKSYPDKMNTPEIVKITLSNQQDDVAKIIAQEKKKTAKGSRVQARQSKQTREILYNTVKEIRIDGPTGNNYKLQYKLVKDVDWQDAGTFSRAVTSWGVTTSGDAVKVTAKPQDQYKLVNLRAAGGALSGGTYSGYIQYSADGGKNWANTNVKYTVDALAIMRGVTLNDPVWTRSPSAQVGGNSNSVTVSTNGRTPQLSKKIDLYMTRGDWNANTGKRYIYVNQGDSTEANRVAGLEVDAHLLDPTWARDPSESISGNSNAVTVKSMTGQEKTINLYLTYSSWNTSTGKRYVYINQGDSSAANRVARWEVDAGLKDPEWRYEPAAGNDHNSNRVTVASKTGQKSEINLYMNAGNWSGGSRYVYTTYNNSSDNSRVMRYEVSVPNPNDLSRITTYGDHYPTGAYSYGELSKSGLTPGKYMSMTHKVGGKTFTFYFLVTS